MCVCVCVQRGIQVLEACWLPRYQCIPFLHTRQTPLERVACAGGLYSYLTPHQCQRTQHSLFSGVQSPSSHCSLRTVRASFLDQRSALRHYSRRKCSGIIVSTLSSKCIPSLPTRVQHLSLTPSRAHMLTKTLPSTTRRFLSPSNRR